MYSVLRDDDEKTKTGLLSALIFFCRHVQSYISCVVRFQLRWI